MADWAIHGCAGTPLGLFLGVIAGSVIYQAGVTLWRIRRNRRRDHAGHGA